jgi:ABC-type thiamine transport system substrate-binding protein
MTLRVLLATMLLATPVMAQMPSNVVEGETIATPELVAAACAEGKVTYYTAQRDADEREIVKKFQQSFPCIQVSIISAVTGRLYERLQTEHAAGKSQADLTILTDEALVERMIEAKMLRKWDPPQAGLFAANAKQDGWWYGASGALMYIVANTSVTDPPKSWADLLDPKWKDAISTSPVTTGGTATQDVQWLCRRGAVRGARGDDDRHSRQPRRLPAARRPKRADQDDLPDRGHPLRELPDDADRRSTAPEGGRAVR